VWDDDRSGPANVWAKRSTDAGGTWSTDVRLSRDDRPGMAGYYGDYGGLAIDPQGALHAAWSEGRKPFMAGGKGGTWYARWNGRSP
jgi:hypothetical protein